MPSWLTLLGGWLLLMSGGLGLWRGATLLLRGGSEARDHSGRDSRLVLVESGGQALLGAAFLLGGIWVHLIWPALLLLTVACVYGIRSWLRTRRHRSSPSVPGQPPG
ncbi:MULTISPECIES: hypothetical protein [Micromonospora]|uniref:hypothetical protein n=1 Tax=Micromonospora TaxID=1873 RepID=UPI000F8838FB|nr:hypothetical protein [Verrucosispora sp. FIM060022]RUL94995.1 hypothetical protein EG812_04895 [Verrucosispora sp. FIM060022]